MASHRSIICGVAVAVVMGWAGASWATIDDLKAYKQAHPDKAAKASCKTCHNGAIGKKGELNAYGLALQASKKAPADAKKLTADEIKAVPEEQPAP